MDHILKKSFLTDSGRKLAERTMSATDQIVETIKAIQNDTEEAAGSMEHADKAIDEGKRATEKTEQVLVEIVNSVSESMDMIGQIAAATEEMSSGADEISRNVETISLVTTESATGAEQIDQLANALKEETISLRELVTKFKL